MVQLSPDGQGMLLKFRSTASMANTAVLSKTPQPFPCLGLTDRGLDILKYSSQQCPKHAVVVTRLAPWKQTGCVDAPSEVICCGDEEPELVVAGRDGVRSS